MNLDNFLHTLFPNGDLVCFTDQPHGYRAYKTPADKDIFFSINNLYGHDKEPTKPWHAANVARRADANVFEYRNFLLELDSMALGDQISYVQNLIPFTSCVYSGGKSHHFIVSLAEPLATAVEYAQVAKRLHKLVNKADPTTKNPSRLSRLPFRTRPETGKLQELKYLGARISFSELDSLLPKLPEYAPKSQDQIRAMVTPLLLKAVHEPDSIMAEMNIGGRNALLYWTFCRFEELQLPRETRQFFVDTLYSNLKDKSGFSYEEALLTARLK